MHNVSIDIYKVFCRNRDQIGNLYTNIMVGHYRKVWAAITYDDRKYYGNKSKVEGRVVIFKSKISKIKKLLRIAKVTL